MWWGIMPTPTWPATRISVSPSMMFAAWLRTTPSSLIMCGFPRQPHKCRLFFAVLTLAFLREVGP